MIDIGMIIREARKSKGLNQTELGNLSECSKKTIVNIESGKKSPTFKLLERICKALDITEIKF